MVIRDRDYQDYDVPTKFGVEDGVRTTGARRIAWALRNGSCPFNKMVVSTCNNIGCMNPRHLVLADAQAVAEVKHARGTIPRGEDAPSARLTQQQVEAIIAEIEDSDGEVNMSAIARTLGVHPSVIQAISAGDSWSTVTAIPESEQSRARGKRMIQKRRVNPRFVRDA